MAVHAQYAFPHHDPRAIASSPALDTAAAHLNDHGCGGHRLAAAVVQPGGDAVFSDLACDEPTRKRARVAAACLAMDMQAQHAALLPPVPQAFAAAGDVQSTRVLCSGAASTSGRPAQAASPGLLLSHLLYRHGVEIDALVRAETERLRAGLQDARRRHARAVFSAAERAVSRRLRAAEAGLSRALARSAELDERLREAAAEAQAWRGVAESHEAVAAGLRAALDDLLAHSPCAGAEGADGCDAEDARSCCDERDEEHGAGRSRACRSCGGADACVLVLPCRHLCLCRGCDAAVEACPVCAAAKNGSLHVLLS
ncbi:unnamed protein product [Urochloa decumbens]|uniref:RING-type domain-containing protein n=1 Tax=Urochloa decumbens TaxID=240449 RepID=A0ABC9EJY9_9POAL